MLRRRLSTALGAVAVGLLALAPTSSLAQEIKLRIKGGGFELSGQLKAFDGTKYVIASPALGNMTVDATRFDCISANCPTGPVTSAAPRAQGSPRDVRGKIMIAGSNTIGNALMPALVEGFARKNGFQTEKVVGQDPLDLMIKITDNNGREIAAVDLRRHGSSTSFRQLESKAVEIGMSSRAIKEAEIQKLAAAGLGNMKQPSHEHVLGLDGLMVIVSEENTAVSIPRDKLPAVFSGQITNWADLGLPPGQINVYAPDKDSGTFETFNQLVLKPAGVSISDTAKRTHNHKEQSDWVAADPLGIGFVGIAYQRNAKALNIEMPCGLISQPSVFSMKTEEYPLARRLYLYTSGQPKAALARSLLQFSLSPDAQPIVRDVEFIDQSPESLPVVDQSARIAYALNSSNQEFNLAIMRQFMVDTQKAERLSTTLRFETGSFALDTKAQGDIRRLSQVLRGDTYKERERLCFSASPTRSVASSRTWPCRAAVRRRCRQRLPTTASRARQSRPTAKWHRLPATTRRPASPSTAASKSG